MSTVIFIRCFFALMLLVLCLTDAAAQEYCPDKKTLRIPGQACPPAPPNGPPPPRICSIKVKIEGEAPGARIHLFSNNDGCGSQKRRVKGKTTVIPYSYSKTEIINAASEVTFKDFLCQCNHTLIAEHSEYTFSDDGRRNVIYRTRPKPEDRLFTFKATPRVKPPPPPPPCNNSNQPEPIYLDQAPKEFQLHTGSNCDDLAAGKQYYNQHRLTPDIRGYRIEVRLESERVTFLGFKLLQGQGELACVETPAKPNQQSWHCDLPNDQQYLLRIFNKDPGSAPNLSYRISLHSRGLAEDGYRDWMDKKVLSRLGNVSGPNISPVINALDHQIELLNVEKLDQALGSLQTLEQLTKDESYDRALTSTLLAMIYRYHKKDFANAKPKEIEAIEREGSARFAVMIGDEKDLKRFSKYWLSISKRGMSLEPLGRGPHEKLSELNQKIKTAESLALDNQTFNTADKRKFPIQHVRIQVAKKPYYVLPLLYERDDANTIGDLIKKYIETGKK
jgi:hypothetical protein